MLGPVVSFCCFLPAGVGAALWLLGVPRTADYPNESTRRPPALVPWAPISGSAPGWRVSAPSVIQPISFRALSARKSDRTHVLWPALHLAQRPASVSRPLLTHRTDPTAIADTIRAIMRIEPRADAHDETSSSLSGPAVMAGLQPPTIRRARVLARHA